MAELKTVLAYRDKELGKSEILALCLSSRRNLCVACGRGAPDACSIGATALRRCINEHVLNDDREKVDELCRSMTVRAVSRPRASRVTGTLASLTRSPGTPGTLGPRATGRRPV